MGLTFRLGQVPLAIFTDTSNNVGIGAAANASYKLQVTGATNLTGALSGTSATFSGNMAIGGTTITDANMLNVIGNQSSVNIGLVLNNTNATYPKIYAIQNVNNNLVFYDYSANATRLTISNTGAATFASSIALSASSGFPAVGLLNRSSDNNLYMVAASSGFVLLDNSQNTMYNATPTSHTWQISNSPKMTLNSSGNVGIGTSTIVANDGTSRTFQMGTRLAIQNVVGTQFLLSSNLYYDGAWKYMVAGKGQAIRGTGESGTIQFSLSPTGTAGGSVPNMDGSDVKMIILENGNVGIGTSSPTSNYGFEKNLTIASANNAELQLSQTANSHFLSIGITNGFNFFQTTAGQGYIYYIGGTERMRITSGGAVLMGIGTNSASARLALDAIGMAVYDGGNYRQCYMNGNTMAWWNGSNQGTLSSAGVWTDASDISIKKDVKDIEYGLDAVLKLKPRSYKMKKDDLEQVGFIAQEVEQVIKELVSTDNKGMKGLSYGQLTAVLVKSIQELEARIKQLENKII